MSGAPGARCAAGPSGPWDQPPTTVGQKVRKSESQKVRKSESQKVRNVRRPFRGLSGKLSILARWDNSGDIDVNPFWISIREIARDPAFGPAPRRVIARAGDSADAPYIDSNSRGRRPLT